MYQGRKLPSSQFCSDDKTSSQQKKRDETYNHIELYSTYGQMVHNVQSLIQVTFIPCLQWLFALLGLEIIESPWPVALRDQNH